MMEIVRIETTTSLGLLLLALAGCDQLLGIDPRPDAGSMEARDAGNDLDAPPRCKLVVDDNFGGDSVCPWGGVTTAGATVTADSGELVITPAANGSSYGACWQATPQPFGPDGATLEVSTAIRNPSAYVVLFARAELDAALIAMYANQIALFREMPRAPHGVVARPPGKFWLRLRPDPAGAGIVGEFSEDGTMFTSIGVVPGEIPTHVRMEIGAGANEGVDVTGNARFDRVQFCAPAL